MKNSLENVQERRNQIVEYVQKDGDKTVNELAKYFNVSSVTLRRDLSVLTKMGNIQWAKGMVKYLGLPTGERLTSHSGVEQIKNEIAKGASGYVEANSTLFVNSSSLCWRAINQLADKPLTIITNNIRATECGRHPNTSIILTGGEIRYPKESLVGTVAVKLIETMQSDYTLIGCDGIRVDKGITTQNIYEAEVNNTMIMHTKKKVICVADYRKIGVASNYHVTDIEDIDILITDRFANEKTVRSLMKAGVEVIQVSE